VKTIKFIPLDERASAIASRPATASSLIPKWFKEMSQTMDDNFGAVTPSHNINLTVKACPPFLDCLTAGYMLTLDADVNFVEPERFGYRVMWKVSWDVVVAHDAAQVVPEIIPSGFESQPLKWITSWKIKTPPGYSLLFTHPFNRNDLPFLSISAIVDTDTYNAGITIPFLVKENFFGIVKKGTPIAQIIPIKRETWNHTVASDVDKNQEYENDNLNTVFFRSYKDRWWRKKTYK
jgi:hypothetical protein